eukprot:GHVS01033410.1.p1 GENE.GHVS01033410.1~~GHVS01033410.1.p1  ORF type:complete len:228 (-),score=35.18 GHVS01033410.1:243-926(-)
MVYSLNMSFLFLLFLYTALTSNEVICTSGRWASSCFVGVGSRAKLAMRRSAVCVSPREGVIFENTSGKTLRVGVVKTRWNPQIVNKLEQGVMSALEDVGVREQEMVKAEVPGCFELPLTVHWIAQSDKVDVVVALGCLIKGETMHFEYIADAVTHGLMKSQLKTGIPVVFGVLTVGDLQQAESRCEGPNNHGYSWGQTAVEMGLLRKSAKGGSRNRMGFDQQREPNN